MTNAESPSTGEVEASAFQLSPRETECMEWVSKGKSSSDIAVILSLSPRTVDSYMEKVCSKLRVRTRIEAVAVAVRHGLVAVEPWGGNDESPSG